MSGPRRRRILYLQYTNPAGYPPLEHSSRILANTGWEVLFLGTGAFGADGLKFSAHPRIQVRQLRFCSPGWRQKLHYVMFCIWCFGWALIWRPSWVYASEILACPAALLLNLVLRLRLLYHEHDSPGEPKGAFQRLCLWARKACARRAERCVLPNQRRAQCFIAETNPRNSVEVVWNCPARAEATVERNGASTTGFKVLYHGSIGPVRLPLTVLEAVALLPSDIFLVVAGYETVGSEGYMEKLKSYAMHLGVADRLKVIGALPTRVELLEICRGCDVGLAFMPSQSDDPNLQAMTGASNKPFDYLACGLPVLVSDLPDWREMFVKPGYGVCCDSTDPTSIASAIRRFYENPIEMRAKGEKGRQRIAEEWNYETQFRRVMALLAAN